MARALRFLEWNGMLRFACAIRPITKADLWFKYVLFLLPLRYRTKDIMEDWDDSPPVYYVNDFEDDQSDAHSINTATSGFTEHSMSTLMSSEAAEYFRQVHGRAFPLAQNAPLVLPADRGEVQRLDLQYIALKYVLNGIYFGPVKDMLCETGDRRKRALDLFTCEGNWVREMAAEFPHVDFTSVDTVPLVPHVQSRNILGYEVYDLYNGIAEPDESFDLVYAKRAPFKIWDLSAFVLEIYRVLRPGGLLIWSEFEVIPRDASVADHNVAEKSPNLARAWHMIVDSCTRQGVPIHACRDAPLLLDPQNAIWHNEESASTRARGFTSIRKETKMLHIAPWHPSLQLPDAGVVLRQLSCELWASFIPLFIHEGLSESEAEELVLKMCMETNDFGTKQLYVNYHMLYAFKQV